MASTSASHAPSANTPRDTHAGFFISYSTKDFAFVQSVYGQLQQRGIQCWFAPRNIQIGTTWPGKIVEGIEQCQSFILFVSKDSLDSIEVLREVALAHDCRRNMYVILIPPASVSGDMRYYLAGWNWYISTNKSPREVADALIRAIDDNAVWNKLAMSPSRWRHFRYGPLYLRILACCLAAGLVLLGSAYWALNSYLNHDYRRLGYVALDQATVNPDAVHAHLQVWNMANGIAFRDLRLAAVTGPGKAVFVPEWSVPNQVGSVQFVDLALPIGASSLATCLSLPSPKLHALYRVTQQFTIQPANGTLLVAETANPNVSREDNSPCRVSQPWLLQRR